MRTGVLAEHVMIGQGVMVLN